MQGSGETEPSLSESASVPFFHFPPFSAFFRDKPQWGFLYLWSVTKVTGDPLPSAYRRSRESKATAAWDSDVDHRDGAPW